MLIALQANDRSGLNCSQKTCDCWWQQGEARRATPDCRLYLLEQTHRSILSLNFRYLVHSGRAQQRSRVVAVDTFRRLEPGFVLTS